MSALVMDKPMSLKKKIRLEKKKQKLTAFAMISELNGRDKKRKVESEECNESTKKQKQEEEKVRSDSGNEPIEAKPEMLVPGSAEHAELRQRLRARKRVLSCIPRLQLNAVGNDAVFKPGSESAHKVPLYISDVQDLIAFCLSGNTFHCPRWCRIEKIGNISHVAALIIEGVSSYTYSTEESRLPTLCESDAVVEIVTPCSYGGDLVDELAHVPISPARRRQLLETFESVDAVLQNNSHFRYKMLRSMFPIAASSREDLKLPAGDQFSRIELILCPSQLIEENYPVIMNEATKEKYKDYVFSKEEYTSCTSHSPLFALDCEMCLTDAGQELTRVSIVDESYTVVYNSYVKPHLPIRDYLTRYSGVTPKLLEGVTTRLCDVQKALRTLLPPDAILVGQSLNCDLHALKMMHPYIIDTSVIYNITGYRERKSKLITLAHEFLNERIQQESKGHCSIEDSTTCIKLVKLKLLNSPEFGDAVLSGREEAVAHRAAAAADSGGVLVPKDKRMVCPQITQGLVYCGLQSGFKLAVAGNPSAVQRYTTGCVAKNQALTKINEDASAAAVARAAAVMKAHSATLIHVSAPEDPTDIDKWTLTVWNQLPPSGMLIVVLGGSSQPTTGLCLVRINKNRPI